MIPIAERFGEIAAGLRELERRKFPSEHKFPVEVHPLIREVEYLLFNAKVLQALVPAARLLRLVNPDVIGGVGGDLNSTKVNDFLLALGKFAEMELELDSEGQVTRSIGSILAQFCHYIRDKAEPEEEVCTYI